MKPLESMRKLFNEYETYNIDAQELDKQLWKAIEPILNMWIKCGYAMNDIESVAHSVITVIACEKRLIKAMQMKKDENKRKVFFDKGEEKWKQ